MGNVEVCDNVDAYLNRGVQDTVDFYDYYADFMYAETDAELEESACRILEIFYERTNILALSFMDEYKSEFITLATNRIESNSLATKNFSIYINENNDLVKALNAVYNGVDGETAQVISNATIKLVRSMLED